MNKLRRAFKFHCQEGNCGYPVDEITIEWEHPTATRKFEPRFCPFCGEEVMLVEPPHKP